MLTDSVRLIFTLGFAATLATTFGCRRHDTHDPEGGRSGNLCRDYASCDACIAGQVARGFKKGAAQTQCGAAVTGCWTTWEKPVICSGHRVDDPQLEEAKARAAAEEAGSDGAEPLEEELPSVDEPPIDAETDAEEASVEPPVDGGTTTG